MKFICFILLTFSLCMNSIAQSSTEPRASIGNYGKVEGAHEKIKRDELLKIGKLSLNTTGYSIVSFMLTINSNGEFKTFEGNSSTITDDMKNAIRSMSLKSGNRIIFEVIKVKNTANELRVIPSLLFKLID